MLGKILLLLLFLGLIALAVGSIFSAERASRPKH